MFLDFTGSRTLPFLDMSGAQSRMDPTISLTYACRSNGTQAPSEYLPRQPASPLQPDIDALIPLIPSPNDSAVSMVNLSFLLCFSEGGSKYKISNSMKELPQPDASLDRERDNDILYRVSLRDACHHSSL